MTPAHPRWDEFCERLESVTWQCGGGMDKTMAWRILDRMGFSRTAIKHSFAYFEEHGGYCDCEILFNVAATGERTQ